MEFCFAITNFEFLYYWNWLKKYLLHSAVYVPNLDKDQAKENERKKKILKAHHDDDGKFWKVGLIRVHFSYFWKWSIEKYRKNELWVNLCSIGFYALCVCCVVGYKMIKFHFNNSIFHNAMRTKSTFIIYWNEHHLLLRWAIFLLENWYMLYFCFS